MPRRFPLSAVLTVRQHKEDAEERALRTLAAGIAEVHAAVSRIDRELVNHRSARASEIAAVHSAAHHLAVQNRWRVLQDARASLLSELQQLEQKKREQMARYLLARSDREMLTELRTKQREAWHAEIEDRELKRVADLFAARLHRG